MGPAVIWLPKVLWGDADDGVAGSLPASAAPQSPQNGLSGGLPAAHFGQMFTSGAPQWPQNLFFGFFAPTFGTAHRLANDVKRSALI